MPKMSILSFPTRRLIKRLLKRGNAFRISFLVQFISNRWGLIGITNSRIGILSFSMKNTKEIECGAGIWKWSWKWMWSWIMSWNVELTWLWCNNRKRNSSLSLSISGLNMWVWFWDMAFSITKKPRKLHSVGYSLNQSLTNLLVLY